MKITIEVELSDYARGAFSDTVFEAIGKTDLTDYELIYYFNMLPLDIKLEALSNGFDTESRERICTWLERVLE